jgi:hypothetical protein
LERQHKQPTGRGSAEWITGDVYVDRISGNETGTAGQSGTLVTDDEEEQAVARINAVQE